MKLGGVSQQTTSNLCSDLLLHYFTSLSKIYVVICNIIETILLP
jgi:hypothetical protein